MKYSPTYDDDNNVTTMWIKGIPYEIAFWNNVYRWRHTFQGLINWSKYGSVISLEGYDANTELSALPYSPIVLDVGCGMSYATGNFLEATGGEKRSLDIRYIDPLADYYNAILRKYKKQLPDIEFAMAEYLSAFYPQNSIDLIVIQNALDHSARPMKSITESITVLKNGGVLYLNHHVNEAEMEKYKGFHQYNICEDDGKLLIWNNADRYDVEKEIADFAVIEKVEKQKTGHVIAIIRKTREVPMQFLADKKDKRELCTILVKMTRRNDTISGFIKRKAVFWKYNCLQFFAQSLPWTVKMRLKRFIKQA